MEFILNGKSSRNFNLKIKESNHLLRPRKKIELIDIPGRTGALIIDEGARENFNLVISGFFDIRKNAKEIELREYCYALDKWLNGTIGYQTMEFDDGTILKVVFTGEINPEYVVKNFNAITLEFSAYREVEDETFIV